MTAEKMEWMVRGEATDACNSPPMCPLWWGSPVQEQLHGGKNRGEGAFTFNIREGYYGNTDLSGLLVGYGMNTPEPANSPTDPWPAILYIDDRADDKQAKALEDIFSVKCHGPFKVIKVKRAKMTFIKQAVGKMNNPGYRFTVDWEGIYHLETEPIMAMNGEPRTLSGMADNSLVYCNRSVVNKYNDPDLPRSSWDAPGNGSGAFDFSCSPSKPYFDP
jgi:hypothetical protein